MRILVTGSRQIVDQGRIYRELDAEYEKWLSQSSEPAFVVVHGAAPGADALAGQWAWDRRNETPAPDVEVHPAKWRQYGRLAGHIRNAEMVEAGADLVLAFFHPGAENRGTTNCVTQARLKGLTIRELWD